MSLQKKSAKQTIGVSACLMGEPVRYDGGHKLDTYITETLAKAFEIVSFCPEVDAGLGVPRNPIKLCQKNGKIRAIQQAQKEVDMTMRLESMAKNFLDVNKNLCGLIVKSGSPSCALNSAIILGPDADKKGAGIFTKTVMSLRPDIPITEVAQQHLRGGRRG